VALEVTVTAPGRRPPEDPLEFVSYADFGEQFFRYAVTRDRVLGAVNLLAGRPIDLGPTGVGPGRVVRLRARGRIDAATSVPVPGSEVGHRVTLPVRLAFEIDLGVETHRFEARLVVPLVLTARAAHGLKVFLEVTPPEADEIGIDLQARGLRASVLQRVAGLEGEVRRFVARYVARELDQPYVRAARLVDVAGAIDTAWERLGPHAPSPTAAHITEDFQDAVQARLDESAGGRSR
jgi:hypothetical protein